jgi:hypothetical protein
MSFALEFRKQQQQKSRDAALEDKARNSFVALPAQAGADTKGNRRRVMLALLIAGSVLSIFNSEGLVRYTQNLAGNPIGEKLIVMSENWHALMQDKQVTRVADHIRGSVAMARGANWRDLTFGFRGNPDEQPQPAIVPAKQEVPLPPEPEPQEIAKPDRPVMRASVEWR